MKFLCFLLGFIILSGCTASDSSTHRRGRLSDAVEAASDQNSGERNVNAEFRPPSDQDGSEERSFLPISHSDGTADASGDISDSLNTSATDDSVRRSSRMSLRDADYHSGKEDSLLSENEREYALGLTAGGGFLSSNDFIDIRNVGISLSTTFDEDLIAVFGAQFTVAPVKRNSLLSHSIDDDVFMLGVNVQFNIPMTPQHTFVGQYLFIGGGTEILFWNYKNPFTAPVYTSGGVLNGQETISSDRLNGVDLFTGIGFDLSQTAPVHLIIELRPGVLLWSGTTAEGFENDIFDHAAYVQLRIKLSFNGL